MKTSTTFSVLFWLKRSKTKNSQAPLYARVTVNGKRIEISLKRKVTISEWDNNKNRLRGNKPIAKLLNSYLNQVQNKLYECQQELIKQGKLVTPQNIKAKFLSEDEQHYTLDDIIEYHNDKAKDKLRWGTLKNYYTTQGYLKEFLKVKLKTSNLYLKELSYKFIIDFEQYLHNYKPKDHRKPMGNNTVMKHLERFRKMITLAFKLEWINRDPFIKYEAKYIRKDVEFLEDYELEAVIEKEFSIERLQIVKDLFVFSCYTGLAYIDVMNLTEDNIVIGIDGSKWIFTSRQKTSTTVKIPLLQVAKDIIEKYKEHPKVYCTNKLLPKLSNQKLNSYLKEIADLCEIDKNLTFHTARHTFGTTVTLRNGVPIETVSKLMGHTKIATTQIYARVLESKVSEDMNVLRSKLFNNKNKKVI